MKRTVLLAFALGACAQTYAPIIDLKGVDNLHYETDLAECRQFADELGPPTDAVVNAILVTAALAAMGAIAGAADDNSSVAEGAGVLAAFGAGLGVLGIAGAESEHGKKQANVVRKCLENRGYKVLA